MVSRPLPPFRADGRREVEEVEQTLLDDHLHDRRLLYHAAPRAHSGLGVADLRCSGRGLPPLPVHRLSTRCLCQRLLLMLFGNVNVDGCADASVQGAGRYCRQTEQ